MHTHRAGWLAWSMFMLVVALSLSSIPLVAAIISTASVPSPLSPPGIVAVLQASAFDWIAEVSRFVAGLAFSALGALIVSRYPAHAIGWIFCMIGVLDVVEPFTAYYALCTLFVAPGVLPGGLVAGWLQNWIWVVSTALLSSF